MSGTQATAPLPSPLSNQGSGQTSYAQSFPPRPSPSPAPTLQHHTSYGSHGSASASGLPSGMLQTPLYQAQQSYNQYPTSSSTPVAHHPNPLTTYNNYQSTPPAPRPVPQTSTSHNAHGANVYNVPRQIEVYTLPDQANSAIPADIRSQFHRDEYGRIIFYTAPPLDANPVPEEKQSLGHSLEYLANKARNKEEVAKKRKAREAELEAEASARLKFRKADEEEKKQLILDQRMKALNKWCVDMNNGTDDLYKQLHGDQWKEMREFDLYKLAAQQEDAFKKQKEIEEFKKTRSKAKGVKITGFNWI